MASVPEHLAGQTPAGDVLHRLQDVTFRYPNGGVLALDGLSLDIPRSSSIGVIGPSGCGKSTLLLLLAGLYQPDKGTVLRSSATSSDERPAMTMVFQKDTLLPWLTVEENIKIYWKFHRNKRQRKAIDERVKELVDLASLHGFERAYPHQLSGGMRKRVAFLAAVAPMPETLLLDEPFSSLDEPTRVALHQDVFKITRQLGMSVLLVTHDLAEAISLCDEVDILTNRPAKVSSRHTVPFGRERDMLTLRQTEEFLHLYGTLWHDLSLQIARTAPAAQITEEAEHA